MTKMDKEVLDHVIHIRESVSRIDEHLQTLNSKVARNVQEINANKQIGNEVHKELDRRINDIKITLAKWGAVVTVIVATVAGIAPLIIPKLIGLVL